MPKTTLSQEDLEDFFQLVPQILLDYRDTARGPFELVYIYSETKDNWDSCFLKAVELSMVGAMKTLAIGEGDLGHGYEGFDASVERLKALGWDSNIPILELDVDGNVNTGSEAKRLARHIDSMPILRDIGVIAPPFHLVRAFMTTISAIVNAGGTMPRVWAIPGSHVPWNAEEHPCWTTHGRTRTSREISCTTIRLHARGSRCAQVPH